MTTFGIGHILWFSKNFGPFKPPRIGPLEADRRPMKLPQAKIFGFEHTQKYTGLYFKSKFALGGGVLQITNLKIGGGYCLRYQIPGHDMSVGVPNIRTEQIYQ